jgi:hypothetical protein
MMAAFCLSGILCARAQDEGLDLKTADLESRIYVERDAVSDLRQRQVQAQREKSILLAEIEQEVGRISKLNREIKPSPRGAHPRASWKKRVPIPEACPAAPAAAAAEPVVCVPSAIAAQKEPALSVPSSDGLAVDAESQAEIDRLVEMREKLIAERDDLEQIVKP